jgi:Major tropism determinant N-terminal domain
MLVSEIRINNPNNQLIVWAGAGFHIEIAPRASDQSAYIPTDGATENIERVTDDHPGLSITVVGSGEGVPTDDQNGSYHPVIPSMPLYQGPWEADSAMDPIAHESAELAAGMWWRVSVAGTTDLDGFDVWQVHDCVMWSGTYWMYVANLANHHATLQGLLPAVSAPGDLRHLEADEAALVIAILAGVHDFDFDTANRLQLKRGDTAELSAYTPEEGELVFDETLGMLRIGDGATAMGVPANLPIPSEAEFEAAAARRRDEMAASGFIEWGKHEDSANRMPVNEGMYVADPAYSATLAKFLLMARFTGSVGESNVQYPLANINGYRSILRNINTDDAANDQIRIPFPDAPAVSSFLYRQDMAFLEVWHEALTPGNDGPDGWVYPYGNVQYKLATYEAPDGTTINTVLTPGFTGDETYSLFGAWQADSALIGRAIELAGMTPAQIAAFCRDPENNIYQGKDGLVQVRYRFRTLAGVTSDPWSDNTPVKDVSNWFQFNGQNRVQAQCRQVAIASDYSGASAHFTIASTSNGPDIGIDNVSVGAFGGRLDAGDESYAARAFALPIALIARRNTGAWHPVQNPNGAAEFAEDGTPANYWALTEQPTTVDQCFDGWTGGGGEVYTIANGDITSGRSGRPDGLYYDQISEVDVRDLRNSALPVNDMAAYIDKQARKAANGGLRGWEGEWGVVATGSITITTELYTYMGYGERITQVQNDADILGGAIYGVATVIDPDYSICIESDSRWYSCPCGREIGGLTRFYLYPKYGDVRADYTIANTYRFVVCKRSTREIAGLQYCVAIGDPANWPAAWTSGSNKIAGVPLVVDQLGADYRPDASRTAWVLPVPISATGDVYKVIKYASGAYSDNTANWTVDADANSITRATAPLATDVFLVFVGIPANPWQLADNDPVIAGNSCILLSDNQANPLNPQILGKIASGDADIKTPITEQAMDVDNAYSEAYPPAHNQPATFASALGGKHLFAVAELDGKHELHVLSKEIRNDEGAGGDDLKIDVIDETETVADNNGTVVFVVRSKTELNTFNQGG